MLRILGIRWVYPDGRTLAIMVMGLLFLSPALAAPVAMFTDLIAAPNTGGENNKGAFVSIYGRGFGTVAGTVTVGGGAIDNYRLWTDTKVTVQLGPNAKSGNVVVSDVTGAASNGLPFTIRTGNIYFVNATSPNSPGSGTATDPWRSPASAYSTVAPNDIVYFRAGTYTAHYGGTWGGGSFDFGTAQSNTAWIGYPGETASLIAPKGANVFELYNGETNAWPTGIVIANLTMDGNGTGPIDGGALFPPTNKGGASNVRVIGNDLSSTGSTGTFYAMLNPPSDGWSILGNSFHNAGTSPPNTQNHSVYVQNGASNLELGWNTFTNLQMGYVIQVHDDTWFEFDNVSIHDNVIIGTNVGDCRGIAIGGVLAGSYGTIWNNIVVNVGQGFAGIEIFNGTWKVYNNTLYAVDGQTAGAIAVNGTGSLLTSGTAPTASIINNIIWPLSSATPYAPVGQYNLPAANMTMDSNLYFGNGTGPTTDAHAVSANPMFVNAAVAGGDFHLQAGSPAIDAGSSVVQTVVTADHDGNPRPQGPAFDIGAYEYVNNTGLPAPTNPQVTPQ